MPRTFLVLLALALSVHATTDTSQAQQPQPVPLLELTNSLGNGRLYTLSESEANSAVTRYGFRLTTTPVAYMWRGPFATARAVYRLRFKVRHSYLLTPSVTERDALVASGRFELEGIAGYVGAMIGPAPAGQTILWRYSKEGKGWPLTVDARRGELEAQGFHRDGPVGYVYQNLPTTPQPPTSTVDPCDPTPVNRGLRIGLAARGLRRSGGLRVVTLRRGGRVRVRGRLESANGGSIGGASVCVTSKRPGPGARGQRIATVTTNRTGRFTYNLKARNSRRIAFVSSSPPRERLRRSVRARASPRPVKVRIARGRLAR